MAGESCIEPHTVEDICAVITDAAASGTKLGVRGGGSKADIGAPQRMGSVLSMKHFSGVVAYEPGELVLTVGAGTPLAEIEALLAGKDQMLAFEPFDHGVIFGKETSSATIGGVVAAGVSGPRRLSMGAARDHLLGFEAVSGQGERFVGGAKVVKNVTGFDVPKIMTGSWGRLAVLTQVTLKVLPRPRESLSIVMEGLPVHVASSAMIRAMRSSLDVSGASFLPAQVGGGPSRMALRLEGVPASLAARKVALVELLTEYGPCHMLEGHESLSLWSSIRHVSLLPGGTLWRIHVPPAASTALLAALGIREERFLLDWAGGLIWVIFDGDAAMLRSAVAAAGGHAMLMRGDADMRAQIPAFHPQSKGVEALSARVRAAFDPAGIFATGRFLDRTDAD